MKARTLSVETLKTGWPGLALGIGLIGLLTLIAGLVTEPTRAWIGLLVAGEFGLSIVLGAAVFAAVNGAARARWWLAVRRAPALLTEALPAPAAAILLVLILGTTRLYSWATHTPKGEHDLIAMKSAWLNLPFFTARGVLILVIWFGLLALLRTGIRKFDGEARPAARSMQRRSVLYLICYAVTISVASWDWTMSLEPEWFSTMYGVYSFAGSFQVGIASVVLIAALVLKGDAARPAVLHDLGRLLFGFSIFWAYIWYCQYMLIWYANVPEEAIYFSRRIFSGWSMLFWLNPILKFVIPFLVLLSARAKRNRSVLIQVAALVVVGHWIDVLLRVAHVIGDVSIPGFALAATAAVVSGMALLLWRAWNLQWK